jgi:hypothetical protein
MGTTEPQNAIPIIDSDLERIRGAKSTERNAAGKQAWPGGPYDYPWREPQYWPPRMATNNVYGRGVDPTSKLAAAVHELNDNQR